VRDHIRASVVGVDIGSDVICVSLLQIYKFII